MTPLDQAHAEMEAQPEDETLRRQFFGLMATSELFLALETEVAADKVRPLILETEDRKMALVFDTEARLAAFSDTPIPFLALSGRRIVALLAGQDLSLGFNLVGAPSAILLPPEVLEWIGTMGAGAFSVIDQLPRNVRAPREVTPKFLEVLNQRLALLAGIAKAAVLVAVEDGSEAEHLLLALLDVPEAAQADVLVLLAEARDFIDPGQALSLVFVATGSMVVDKLTAVGLRFDVPELVQPARQVPEAPGSNPDKPPILR